MTLVRFGRRDPPVSYEEFVDEVVRLRKEKNEHKFCKNETEGLGHHP